MKKMIFLSISLIVFASCSHRVIRTGYKVNKADYRNCEIVIKKNMVIPDSIKSIGQIKLGESGFSTACSEADAIEILRNEGCALNASLINIIHEKRSDMLSSCYRCTADFYSFPNKTALLQSDETYKMKNVDKRVSKDRNKNTVLTIIGGIAGFIVGYTLFQ